MKGIFFTAAATATVAGASASASASVPPPPPPSFTLRQLEDAVGNSYSYLDDLSGYRLSYGKCVRVKIPQENDDDGNVYFYNGRYHAPSAAFASFYLCGNDGGGEGQCGACDYSTEYVVELGQFLELQVPYAQEYCNNCGAQCRRRRRADEEKDYVGVTDGSEQQDTKQQRRKAEDEIDQVVDCDTCVEKCALLLAGNEGNDETYYLECDESYVDDNGIQYYSGPACGSDNNIVIGLYYDDECTIKSQEYENSFAYNTFGTIEQLCVDCSDDGKNGDGAETCGELYQESYHCQDGVDKNIDDEDGDDNMPVCKTYKKASKEWTYSATVKKKNKFIPVLLTVVVLVALSGVFCFLSYTYYVRHTRAAAAALVVSMASLDQTGEGGGQLI